MVEEKDSDEIYGEWISLELDNKDPHYLILVVRRDKPMTQFFVNTLNDKFAKKDVGLEPRILFNYRKWKEQQLKDGKQQTL